MSLRNRFVLAFALSFLAALAGCGSNSNKSTPPPTGGFTDSNLSGTYVFSFSGTDYTVGNACTTCTSSFFSAAGTLSADGKGGLTGTIDLVDPELGAVLTVSAVQTGLSLTGNYDVTSDGRGTGTISFKVGSTTVPMGIDFVLTSNSHGLITRFDSNGTASGTIDAQTSGITQSALAGSFSFGLSGADSTGNPLGTVGTFTLDASGNVTSGSQDFNDNGNSSNLQALPLLASTVTVAATPGTAQLTTSATGFGTLNFDVWPIDASHLKFIETDGTVNLAGDAFSSTGQSFPAGTLVFTMSGLDSLGVPLAEGGLLTSDGTSTISGGLQDVNEEGTVAQSPSINGGISTTGGRTVVSLNGIYNGYIVNSTLETGNYAFAAYPYTYNGAVGVELLEIDNGGVTGGNAYLQSSTSIAASQGYGLNLSGSFETGSQTIAEADLIAEFTTSSTSATGLYDANNGGGLISDYNLGTSATYATGSNGRGTFAFPNLQVNTNNSVTNTLDFTYYTVDSSTAIFIETDSSQIGLGTFQLQNSSSSDLKAAALPHFSMVRAGKAGAKRPVIKLKK
jgi:hypothetical protein